MLSLEEKQALLIKRWEKLNPKVAGAKLNPEDVRKAVEYIKKYEGSACAAAA